MTLLTDELRQMMPGPRAQEHVKDPIVYVKFFITCSRWTWFAYEGWQVVERAPGFILDMSLRAEPLPHERVHDIMFFGWVYGDSPELGAFSLNELRSIRNRLGLGVERDLYFKPMPLSQIKKKYGC